MSTPIPGFTIEDEEGNVVVPNPGQQSAGRRTYQDGQQSNRQSRTKTSHDYLFRAPKGTWKAFTRKCENEGVSAQAALEFLVKDWVIGRIEIEDLSYRYETR